MKAGAKTGCHQLSGRSFSFGGFQFPLCARCTGLAAGHAAGFLLFAFGAKMVLTHIDLRWLFVPAFLSVVILGADGLGQLKKRWVSTNPRRFCTGLACGFFVTVFNLCAVFRGFFYLREMLVA